jgi:hypothetical protein
MASKKEKVAPVQPEQEHNEPENKEKMEQTEVEEAEKEEPKIEEAKIEETKTVSIQENQELSLLSEEKKEAPETAKIREQEAEIVTGEVETIEIEGEKEVCEMPQSRINRSADNILDVWTIIELPVKPGEYFYKVVLKPWKGAVTKNLKVYMYEIKESKITMRYFDNNDSKEISASSVQGLLERMYEYDIFRTQEEAQKRLEEINGQEE